MPSRNDLRAAALRDRRRDMLLCALFRPPLFLARLSHGYYEKEIYVSRYIEYRQHRKKGRR